MRFSRFSPSHRGLRHRVPSQVLDGPGEEPAESCDGQGDDGHEARLPGGEGVRAAARPLHRHHEDAHREVREGLTDIPPTPTDS
ncbi:hypothetical protein AVEN_111163-1 [Araneus ventricosus]|uniref:Uncharacterized protein n=1 Tax=Araneus ventricosus TaxID=182803 RepID=A0A4Y2G210_ARAVE|nr:hypothetical protein AVEN_111163-1 [Araneus ventricosus]